MSLDDTLTDEIESFGLIKCGNTNDKLSVVLKRILFKCPYCQDFKVSRKGNHLKECFERKTEMVSDKDKVLLSSIHEFIQRQFDQTFGLVRIYLKHKTLDEKCVKLTEENMLKDRMLEKSSQEIEKLDIKIDCLEGQISKLVKELVSR